MFKCCDPECPGYPYKASEIAHPCGAKAVAVFAPKFRDSCPRGFPLGKQATKTDLVDIGRAIGATVSDQMSVPEIRGAIRAHLTRQTTAGLLALASVDD